MSRFENPYDYPGTCLVIEPPQPSLVLEAAPTRGMADYGHAVITVAERQQTEPYMEYTHAAAFGERTLPEDWVVRHAASDYARAAVESTRRRREAIAEGIRNGVMPTAANGFSFVIDETPTDAWGHISAAVFTERFSDRQVPMAHPDKLLHGHDIGHVTSYQDMLEKAPVADLLQRAASVSRGDPDGCERFTAATDGLGDAMAAIGYPIFGAIYSSTVLAARDNLRKLVLLVRPEFPSYAALDAAVARYADELELAYYDSMAVPADGYFDDGLEEEAGLHFGEEE